MSPDNTQKPLDAIRVKGLRADLQGLIDFIKLYTPHENGAEEVKDAIKYLKIAQQGWNYTTLNYLMALEKTRLSTLSN